MWQKIIDRHTSLRTIFVPGKSESEWNQVVIKDVHAMIVDVECSNDDALQNLTMQPPLDSLDKSLPH